MMRWVRLAIWALSCVALIALVAEPVSVKTQLFVALCGVAVMAVIRGLQLSGVWRHVFIAIGAGLVLRYLCWRTLNTLWACWFAALALANIYIAHHFAESVWVNFKVFGITIAMMVFMVPQVVWLNSKIKPAQTEGA